MADYPSITPELVTRYAPLMAQCLYERHDGEAVLKAQMALMPEILEFMRDTGLADVSEPVMTFESNDIIGLSFECRIKDPVGRDVLLDWHQTCTNSYGPNAIATANHWLALASLFTYWQIKLTNDEDIPLDLLPIETQAELDTAPAEELEGILRKHMAMHLEILGEKERAGHLSAEIATPDATDISRRDAHQHLANFQRDIAAMRHSCQFYSTMPATN